MPASEINRGFEEDPYLDLWKNLGSNLEVGILIGIKVDKDTDYFNGTCTVYFPRYRQTRDNILISFGGLGNSGSQSKGDAASSFFGMIPDFNPLTDEVKTNLLAKGTVVMTEPTMVVVGFLSQSRGVVLGYVPLIGASAGLQSLVAGSRINKLRKIKSGEPYLRSKSKASLHLDKDGNSTLRFDDTLTDDDSRQTLVQLDKNRQVTIKNALKVVIESTGEVEVTSQGNQSTKINGGEELAFKSALTTLKQQLDDLVAKFNSHTQIITGIDTVTSAPVTGTAAPPIVPAVEPPITPMGTAITIAG